MNKNKKIIIFILLFLAIICSVYYFYNKTKPMDYNKSVKIVKTYIEALNEKNIDKANKYILDTKNNRSLSERYINNINSIKFVSAEKAKVKFKNEEYIMLDGKK